MQPSNWVQGVVSQCGCPVRCHDQTAAWENCSNHQKSVTGPTQRTLERGINISPGPGNGPSCGHAVMFSTHCSAPPGPDQWVIIHRCSVDTVDSVDTTAVDIVQGVQ